MIVAAAAIAVVIAVVTMSLQTWQGKPPQWTDDEVAILRSLWLESLPELPPDPSNAVADNTAAKSLHLRSDAESLLHLLFTPVKGRRQWIFPGRFGHYLIPVCLV